MCFACGSEWPPWSRQIHVAPPPVKTETIYIDDNTQFYPDHRQGIHPPGPVYQTLGGAAPNGFASGMYPAGAYPMQGNWATAGGSNYPNMCNYQIPGFNGQQFVYPQTGWPSTCPSYPLSISNHPTYASFNTPCASEPPHLLHYPNRTFNNTYSSVPFATAPGGTHMPFNAPTTPAELTAQAAAAAEHNKQLSNNQNPPSYMVGANPNDFAAQAAILGQMGGMAGSGPTTLAPYKPGEANQFWCRETDGSWTLRGYSEICLGEVSPGHWEKHAVSGYFFWIRHLS